LRLAGRAPVTQAVAPVELLAPWEAKEILYLITKIKSSIFAI
jgi:hypothetical protein